MNGKANLDWSLQGEFVPERGPQQSADRLEFNGTFSTVRLYRALRSTYSLRFGK